MEKNYRIYSDSDSHAKKTSCEKAEKNSREASDYSSNQSYYMSAHKDGMTSNKVYSMY